MEIVLEMHSTSTDNEAGIASGNRDVPLSETGRGQAAELGERHGADVDVVYCSDLRRAVETAEIAFGDGVPKRLDPRLREQDYGERTGAPSAEIEVERHDSIDVPFPGGESINDVVERVRAFLGDLDDAFRVVVIGHRATKIALDHLLAGVPVKEAVTTSFTWQPGWSYSM